MDSRGLCSVDGCPRQRERRDWCFTHYMRWRKCGDPGLAQIRVHRHDGACSVDGCDRPARSLDLCQVHYARHLRHGSAGTAELQHVVSYEGEQCRIAECERRPCSRGYCSPHYRRWLRWGDPEGKRPAPAPSPSLLVDSVISAQGLDGCVIDACGRPLVARGRCRRHYAIWHRATPKEARRAPLYLKRLSPAERFAEKVRRGAPDECWPFTGSGDEFGHGQFFVSPERGTVPAHSFALELATGSRCPEGKECCHDCDNPPCCNPAHVYFGTRQQNVDDMWRRGRRKLVTIDPDVVRQFYDSGCGATWIARELGVSLHRVHQAMEELGLPRRPVGRVPEQRSQ